MRGPQVLCPQSLGLPPDPPAATPSTSTPSSPKAGWAGQVPGGVVASMEEKPTALACGGGLGLSLSVRLPPTPCHPSSLVSSVAPTPRGTRASPPSSPGARPCSCLSRSTARRRSLALLLVVEGPRPAGVLGPPRSLPSCMSHLGQAEGWWRPREQTQVEEMPSPVFSMWRVEGGAGMF